MKKFLSLIMICTIILVPFTACTNKDNTTDNQTDANQKQDKSDDGESVINLSLSGDISTLDSTLQRDSATGRIISNAVSNLFSSDEEGKLKNELCTEYTVSDDDLTYTFNLRKDAKWSNGDPVTANDFVFSWKRLADPATGATYADFIQSANIVNAAEVMSGEKTAEELGVKALDDYTFEVKLTSPMPSFIEFTTQTNFCPLNEDFVKEKGDKHGTTAENTLYCGAYLVESWEAEYQIVMAKNPDYFDTANVKNDKIVLKIVKDVNTSINLFDTKELDAIDFKGEVSEIYENDPRINRFDTWTMRFFVINNESEIFSNLNARKAIAAVIDKQFILDEIYKDGTVIANYIIPTGLSFDKNGKDYRDSAPDYQTYDIEKGKNYWELAKKELDIDTCSIRIMVGETTLSKKMGEYIQSLLQENLEGLTVKFEQVTAKNDIQKEIDGEFDIKVSSWGNDTKDAACDIQTFTTGYYGNTARFFNEEYNNLYKLMMTDYALDIENRWKAFQRAEKILIDEQVGIIPFGQKVTSYLIQDNVKGFISTEFAPDINFMYIEKDI